MKVPANFRHTGFFDLLCDALYQYRLARDCSDSYVMNRHARASVSASALALECGANCLISSLDGSSGLLEGLDKLPVVAKYETFLRFRGVTNTLDRGRAEVQRIRELVKVRNDYVHPKTRHIKTDVGKYRAKGKLVEFPIEMHSDTWKGVGIPKSGLFWSAGNALSVIHAVTAFFSYLFFDLMEADPEEISHLLQSRLEIENVHVPNMFQEFESELKRAVEYGVDLRFLGME